MRMSMETAVVLAMAMGRTLVLPFEHRMNSMSHAKNGKFSFHDVFNFDSIAAENDALNVISMEEFLEKEVMTGNLRNIATGQVTFPPNNQTSWDGKVRHSPEFWYWLRNSTNIPKWNNQYCVVGFAEHPGVEYATELKRLEEEIPKEKYFEQYEDNPTPVNAPPIDRLKETLGNRKQFCVYGALQNSKVVHMVGDSRLENRLLTHFYTFVYFENWRQDLWTKRFVRDHLRYVDELQCAAARIVEALRQISKENGNPDGIFDSFHIRRGDFFKEYIVEADEIYQNVRDVLEENSTIFVATDDKNSNYFVPLARHYKLYFLKDFLHLIEDVDKGFYGMVDQLVASKARTFMGAYSSTFSGYISRLQGYHSQKEKLPGYEKGKIQSYFYFPLENKDEYTKYMAPHRQYFAREFPISWRDIDFDINNPGPFSTTNRIEVETTNIVHGAALPAMKESIPREAVEKATRPDIHQVAGLNCDKFGGPSEEIAAEMVYWRDIPQDAKFVSPYADYGPKKKYLTFEPDFGGWNNIRMSLETAVALALAMGRTLVLPFEQTMYLLSNKKKGKFTFNDFYHFDSIATEHPGLEVISMNDFIKREVMTGHLRDQNTGEVTFPPWNRTKWDGNNIHGKKFWLWLRNATATPMWNCDKCLLGFAKDPGKEGAERIKTYRQHIPGRKAMNKFIGNPTAVNGTSIERFREATAGRKEFCVYGDTVQKAPVIHFMGDTDSGARLLTYFYSYLYFEDWRQDLWTKRFVRDHMRYHDDIQCAAARVVAALREKAKENGNPDGVYDSFHIRRGDFQYKETRIEADEIYRNVYDVLVENSTVFIATDEKNVDFFQPLMDHYKVYFLSDFEYLIKDINRAFYGMLDQRIASRGRTFVGTYFSTFTGYINRMRGYHSQKDKLPGYEKGEIDSYYYVPTRMKHTMRKYSPVKLPVWAQEFPIGWRDIDHDVNQSLEGKETTQTVDGLSQDRKYGHVDDKSSKRAEQPSRVNIADGSKMQTGTKELPDHRVAGLNCDRFGGPAEEDAAEMVYWRDIPEDAKFVSPYAVYGPRKKYLTFEPDGAGWNNVRMSMETAVVLALTTGRTLVLPFTQYMHQLAHEKKNKFNFKEFFHFDSIASEYPGLKVITMEEFIEREVVPGNLRNPVTGQATFPPPPPNQGGWDGDSEKGAAFWMWLRNSTHMPMWKCGYCVLGFAKNPGRRGASNLSKLQSTIPQNKYFEEYEDNPNAIDASPQDRLREVVGNRKNLCVYGPDSLNEPVIHLLSDVKSGTRLLTHFYTFLFLEDWRQDLWTKRFVRDHLRYVDELQCAAARVVTALRQKARENGNADGLYDSFHIRQGDFFNEARLDANEIYNNVHDVLVENSTMFIATDEPSQEFFEPLMRHYRVYFLSDFSHLLSGFDVSFYGMIDQLVASRGRTFVGAYYSTFTGYITRIRGYHSQKDKLPGYEKGELRNSYYYTKPIPHSVDNYYQPKNMKESLHKYWGPHAPFWAREFPLGWRDIDHDISE